MALPILKELMKRHGRVSYGYFDQDSYLLSKVFQQVITDLRVVAYTYAFRTAYIPSNQLCTLSTINDAYNALSDNVKTAWVMLSAFNTT